MVNSYSSAGIEIAQARSLSCAGGEGDEKILSGTCSGLAGYDHG